MAKKILVFGLTTLDIINLCEKFPQEDEDVRVLKQYWQKGGNAANTSEVLAQLGNEVHLFSAFASGNPMSDFAKRSLDTKGVNTKHCATFQSNGFPTSCCIVTKNTGSRTIMHGYQSAHETVTDAKKKLNLKENLIIICPWGELGVDGVDSCGIVYHSDAFPPPTLIDTLGAGDTFIAGTLSSFLKGSSLQESLVFGCKIAGKKCGQFGFDDIVQQQQLQQQLQTQLNAASERKSCLQIPAFYKRKEMEKALHQDNLQYCKVCRIHQSNGRKHQYGAKHIKQRKEILVKFRSKIKQCEKYLHSPEAVDGELEPGATFWCHFCEQKVGKHVTDRTVSLTFGGLFEHLASVEHHKKTHEFWKKNGGDKADKKDYLVSAEEYSRYKNRCQGCLERFEAQWKSSRAQVADEIRQREGERAALLSVQHWQAQTSTQESRTVNNSHGVLQNPTGWHHGVRVWRGGIVKTRSNRRDSRSVTQHSKESFRTKEVETQADERATSLPMLSHVKRQQYGGINSRKGAGNIHTGAVPPWLRNDEEAGSNEIGTSPEIGPSLDDFKAHVERSKKKKSTSKSVGANFDHTTDKPDDWLPSFGRVWNAGPRWQSRREFKQESKSTSAKKSK
eukprot:Seg1459.3 transcript_id=Seg1459.3/GoldUCD/mRNA.D3Y31 product="Coiled-coil domain-containing protein 84" protein_id=Seg1459.3/GoldUCD/D3Y31